MDALLKVQVGLVVSQATSGLTVMELLAKYMFISILLDLQKREPLSIIRILVMEDVYVNILASHFISHVKPVGSY